MSRGPARWRPGTEIGPVARHLAAGGILAVPTESSYGLAADPRDAAAVAAIRRLKGRDADKGMPVVVATTAQIEALGGDLALAERWGLTALWPAALSVVLPVARELPAAAGRSGVAFRIPAHAGLRELLAAVGHGLTATSANRSGEPPILDPDALVPFLVGSSAMIVDGGALPGGPPSTLVEPGPDGVRVLRAGRVAVDALFSSDAVEILVDDRA